MATKGLNHYSVIGYDLEASKHFYSEIVGLHLLPKRDQGVTVYVDFGLPGSSEPLVSVIDANVAIRENRRDVGFQLHAKASTKGKEAFATGAFEHLCFVFKELDFEEVKRKLLANGYMCQGYDFLPTCKQIWTIDPNGIKLEFMFKG